MLYRLACEPKNVRRMRLLRVAYVIVIHKSERCAKQRSSASGTPLQCFPRANADSTCQGRDWDNTLMARRSPVARFLHRYTRPKAPRLIGFRISKSSIVMLLMLLPLVLAAGVKEPELQRCVIYTGPCSNSPAYGAESSHIRHHRHGHRHVWKLVHYQSQFLKDVHTNLVVVMQIKSLAWNGKVNCQQVSF